ncbi:hypothetical protein [Erythrobacter crassostreae]|uniref:Uncharacterized protein n=1 Tax=Erythrobacter crassostreae TaxID=2828328 RepID=A0A9X1F472_9SPHN|nr:hypothetical protein [Erythrobacter crassostrea]MBV7259802.1 hypothetical protein [Erythrobacter crassostrea]
MFKVKYSRARLSVYLFLILLMAAGGFWVWTNFDGKGAFMALLMAVVMVCCIPFALRYILLDNTILEVRGNAIDHHGLFGTTRFSKEDVLRSSVETTTTNGVASNRHLFLGDSDNFFLGKRVSEQFLASEFRPIEKLIVTIAEGGPASDRRRARPAQRIQESTPEVAPVRTFGRKST